MDLTPLHRLLDRQPGRLTDDMLDAAIEQGNRETDDLDRKSELPEAKDLWQSDLALAEMPGQLGEDADYLNEVNEVRAGNAGLQARDREPVSKGRPGDDSPHSLVSPHAGTR